jgi:hypothetical protein
MLMLDMLILMVVISCLYFVVQSFGIGRCLMPVFFPVHPVLSPCSNLSKRSYHYKNL